MDDLYVGLGLRHLEPLDDIRAETNPPLTEAGKHPPPAGAGNRLLQPDVGNKNKLPQGVQLTCPRREGAGDSWSWFDRSVQEAEWEEGESQSPPYLIGPAPARLGAIGQIYEHVAGKDPPPGNITSEAIQAYYLGIEAQMVKMWACQVLCMIAKYHMACVTRGLPVTSPILPGIIEDKLSLLAGYALPEDRSGVTDVRVRDHQAKTLRVAVWLHRLDMALSREPVASGSLVWIWHSVGHLLAYFLAPGTTWSLWFEDVADQVLRENRKHNERR